MTQIAATDSALVRLLESCDLRVPVRSAPHQWDDGFIQRLITEAPTILVSFVGGDEYEDTKTSTVLDLAGKWSVYVVTGWHGRDQAARRLGVGGGLDLMHRTAAVLHTATLFDENGERLPQVRVEGLGVEADSAIDISNLWVGTIACDINLPLELLESESCFGPLDEFLEARATFDIEGGEPAPALRDAGTLGDVPARVDIDQ